MAQGKGRSRVVRVLWVVVILMALYFAIGWLWAAW